MNKEDLIVGVHNSTNTTKDSYNVIDGFTEGLIKGFKNNGVKVYSTKDCFEKGLTPNLTIGFNALGYNTWADYLNHGITNIMWSINSVFAENIEAVGNFYTNPKFVLFNPWPSDTEPLQSYLPQLQFAYMPHAVDTEVWKKQAVKKEHDLVLISSIIDYDAKIEELKQIMPKESFDLLMIMHKTWVDTSNLSFWQLYEIFKKEGGLNFNLGQYHFAFKHLTELVDYTKQVQMIEKLQDFNLKIFGEGPWEKYVKGKVKYMGKCDFNESVDIINKSKIILHNQSSQSALGLDERILNASAVETFVISSENALLKQEFEDTLGYFKGTNFENLEDSIKYHLKNTSERAEKAKKAHDITIQRHTWDIRAAQILGMINYN